VLAKHNHSQKQGANMGRLVLTRRPGESFIINDDITVKVIRVDHSQVKVLISAPDDVEIWRNELYRKMKKENDKELVKHGRDG